jgi:HEAT repeat protein
MLGFNLLLVALAVQGAIIALCLSVLLVLRLRMTARLREVDHGLRHFEPVLHRWLTSEEDPVDLVRALRAMPAHAALRASTRLTTALVPAERHPALARALRDEPWVRAIIARGRSRLWWRRFDAARLLCVAGQPIDAPLVTRLLADRSPAVRLVAFDAAVRLGDRRLIDRGIGDLVRHQDAVQAYHFAALGLQPVLTGEALCRRLASPATSAELVAWIDAAGALATPAPLRAARLLARHEDADVRVHAARAIRRLAEPETVPVLIALLDDADWRVRAQAARALGALRVVDAVEPLARAVTDRAWWVRYRAALALAQVGGTARAALLAIADGEDALARDMAHLVTSLSPSAVIEMSEV